MNRDAFLARVREAAHAGRAHRVHVRDDIPLRAGYVGGGDDLVARMADEVESAGGRAHVALDLAAAGEALKAILQQSAAHSALCWEHPLLARMQLGALLQSVGVEMISQDGLAKLPPAEQRTKMLAAEIGITSTTFAIAETGTLALASAPGSERLASLAPPIHVAVVETAQILPDLFDLFERLQADGLDKLASNLVLITGPSKTGDIELKLTTGVHGPGEWHVILIR